MGEVRWLIFLSFFPSLCVCVCVWTMYTLCDMLLLVSNSDIGSEIIEHLLYFTFEKMRRANSIAGPALCVIIVIFKIRIVCWCICTTKTKRKSGCEVSDGWKSWERAAGWVEIPFLSGRTWNEFPSSSHKLHKICMVALFGRRQHERSIVSIEYLLISLFLLCECESACFVLFGFIFDGVFFFILLVYNFDRNLFVRLNIARFCFGLHFSWHIWPHRCSIRSALNFKRGLLLLSTSFFTSILSLSFSVPTNTLSLLGS